MSRGRTAIFIGMALLLLGGGCAGYRVGARSLYPPEIRTVYVPIFESNSYRRGLGEQLTEAVVKQIQLRTPLEVVAYPDADSVLTGTLISDRKRLIVISPTDEPRQSELFFEVQIRWIDRKGDLIRDETSIPIPAQLVDSFSAANITPEVGQSGATAQQEAIHQMAQQIVSLMEAPW